jgi:transketolase
MNMAIELKAINTIRLLSADGIQKANSGHPGLPMGAAPMAYVLWNNHLKTSAKAPKWADRDRFVLSAGHGSMMLYSLLHLHGYKVSMEDLQSFRQEGSKTPGHPEFGHTDGVETTTGPLGQGIANAVGMAVAEARLAAEFNTDDFKVVDHYTYAIAGDGCMMEGISSEASSLAGHLGLGKMILLYDSNQITIDGRTDITFTEDIQKRYEAYGWQVLEVADGNNDLDALDEAMKAAKAETEKPSLIVVKTTIGYGSPNKADSSGVHGSPLGEEELKATKEALGWDPEKSFYIPEDVQAHYDAMKVEKAAKYDAWTEMFAAYEAAYPEKAAAFTAWMNEELPAELLESYKTWEFDKSPVATRVSGSVVMNKIAEYMPNLVGGSADLNASTKTYLAGKGEFQKDNHAGNNINYGIREFAMGAVMNGVQAHGGLRIFGSTFMVFSDYVKPALRVSALMGAPVIHVFTHDSIAVGEDGPTHEPIEQLWMLRGIPNVNVWRPATTQETAFAWMSALKETKKPSVIALSRQNLPQLAEVNEGVEKGAYVLIKEEKETPDLLLMATGSEVHLMVEAQKALKAEGIDARVISMPCLEVFEAQDADYKESVIPAAVQKRVIFEVGSTMGWYRYVGSEGLVFGIDQFGESAPGGLLLKKYGFTVENVIEKAKSVL